MLNFYLLLLGVCIYYLMGVLKREKKYNFSLFLESESMNKKTAGPLNKLAGSMANNRFLSSFRPSYIIKEAQKYNWKIGYRDYWLYVFGTGITYSGFAHAILSTDILSFASFFVGFTTPSLLLYASGKKHKGKLENSLIIYMKATANSMSVHGNVVSALQEVSQLVGDWMKNDIEKVISLLQSGKPMREAFHEMDEKYNYKEIHFFHRMLEVAHKEGSKNDLVLKSASDDFEQKKFLQVKLETTLTQTKRSFFQIVIYVLLMPFIFKFAMPDMYELLLSNPVGKGVLVTITVILLLMVIKVEKLSQFNPDGK